MLYILFDKTSCSLYFLRGLCDQKKIGHKEHNESLSALRRKYQHKTKRPYFFLSWL